MPIVRGLLLAAAVATQATAPAPSPSGALRLERAVSLMRHGVRPPTRALPVPVAVAPDPWPAWPVPFGWLTPHGAERIANLARHDRAAYAGGGLLPRTGCPAEGAVAILADSDQRTIATADAYARALAPGCPLAPIHAPDGQTDPLFSPISAGAVAYDAAEAAAAVKARFPSGVEAVAEANRGALTRLQAILAPACNAPSAPCALGSAPTTLAAPKAGARPKLEGALDLGSTAAQVLLLEYAEGKPPSEVGWGRATAADVTRLSALHAAEFDVLARTPYVARRNAALIARAVLDGLGPKGARLTVLVGHDTNVASLAGLLDAHFAIEGYAPDDPAPGGALVFERLRDARGARFVRVVYEAQTLEQLRGTAAGAPQRKVLRIPACGGDLCPEATFRSLLAPAAALARPPGA